MNPDFTIPQMSRFIQDRLTQKLTAFILGLSHGNELSSFESGTTIPDYLTIKKMRLLFSLIHKLSKHHDPETLQVWFLGKKSSFNGDSPASALNKDFFKEFEEVSLISNQLND